MNQLADPSAAELMRRVSSFKKAESLPSFYLQTTSLDAFPVLESMPSISIRDRRWAGLYIHSIAMGFVSTALPLTVYPFLTGYLNMEGTQTLSARALLALPWVLRPLFNMIATSLPGSEAWRFRRCLVVGWSVANIALTVAGFIDVKDPFFPDKDSIEPRPLSQLNATELSLLNLDAPAHGALYVMLLAIAAIGLVLADVGADLLIEQVSKQHFALFTASPFVSDMIATRITGMLAAFVFMGLATNGEDYGGDFGFSLRFNRLLMVVGFVAALPTPAAQFCIAEHSVSCSSFASWRQTVWNLFQHRGVSAVITCRLLAGVARGMTATPGNPIALYWANVQPINDNALSFVTVVAAVGVVRLAEKKGWVLYQVPVFLAASVLVLAVDCSITMATIWDVVRSKYLWLGMPLLQAVPSALEYVLLHGVIDDVAEPETAELSREIVAAVAVLESSLGTVATKLLGAAFDVANDDILGDSDDVRSDATTVFLVAYAAQLLSFAWVFALPRPVNPIREPKIRHGGPSARRAGALVGVLAVGLVLSVVVHVLAVNKATACLWIAGGNGCE